MQTKLQSLSETSAQIITDVAGNTLIAVPMAYFLHNIKLEAITEIFFVMLVYNFGKSYVIRRVWNKRQAKSGKNLKSAV